MRALSTYPRLGTLRATTIAGRSTQTPAVAVVQMWNERLALFIVVGSDIAGYGSASLTGEGARH